MQILAKKKKKKKPVWSFIILLISLLIISDGNLLEKMSVQVLRMSIEVGTCVFVFVFFDFFRGFPLFFFALRR